MLISAASSTARPAVATHSLVEDQQRIRTASGQSRSRRLVAFMGPGFLVAVGYMDPGNWATDIAGGSAFGYTLLSAILLSSLMAMVLQALAARLGVASGMDLAQACRKHFSRPVGLILWALAEIAIIACELAEVLGSAIALQLLFGIPLVLGVLLTTVSVFLILALQRFGFRAIEVAILMLLLIISACFAYELFHAKPDVGRIFSGLVPTADIVTDPAKLLLAIGILGATVMPHNLYLHSALVQTRDFDRSGEGRAEAARLATWDSSIALSLAFVINASILIVAAAVFHTAGRTDIAEIDEAYTLLTPMMGAGAASIVFGVALLASGQNATITGALAGQIVMEGFLNLRFSPWIRRLVTRSLAVVPALWLVGAHGDVGVTRLLILSQVVLSLQLPFAVIPLVLFTGKREIMGSLASPLWLRSLAWGMAALVVALNVTLLWNFR